MTGQVLRTVIRTAFIAVLMVNIARGATRYIVGENESTTVRGDMSDLTVRDTAQATLKKSAKLLVLDADGHSEVVMEEGADVWLLTATDNSVVRISGGTVSFLTLRDGAKAILEKDAGIAHVQALDRSLVVLEEGAEVDHLTTADDSMVHASGRTVAFLNAEGRSRARVKRIRFKGAGSFSASGMSISGGAISYAPSAKIHIYGDSIAFNEGRLTGYWNTGEPFSIWLVARDESRQSTISQSMPAQLIAHELPVPSFDCRKAHSGVEKTICASEKLARLDRQLSQTYKQVLAASPNASEVRQAQRRWLHQERDICGDSACLNHAYEDRFNKIVVSQNWMTNDKAQVICGSVLSAVNDGSTEKHLVPFQRATEEEQDTWRAPMPSYSSLWLSRTLTINQGGKVRTLGLIEGGGTCETCEIVDIAAEETELYPPDDDEERLRWASWAIAIISCSSMVSQSSLRVISTAHLQAPR